MEEDRLIYGVDTGSNRVHMVGLDGTQEYIWVDPKKFPDPDDRRQDLYVWSVEAFSNIPTTSIVACEEPLALQNGKTTRILGLAAGAIWAAHLQFDVFWTWVNVSTWKRETVGKANANKDQVIEWVKENMGLDFDELGKKGEDFYDAAAIAYCVRKLVQKNEVAYTLQSR